jgi:hypothetical protein
MSTQMRSLLSCTCTTGHDAIRLRPLTAVVDELRNLVPLTHAPAAPFAIASLISGSVQSLKKNRPRAIQGKIVRFLVVSRLLSFRAASRRVHLIARVQHGEVDRLRHRSR